MERITPNPIHPAAVDFVIQALEGTGDYGLDVMTIIIKSSNPLIYRFPIGDDRLMEAKHSTWKYFRQEFDLTNVAVTFLCLVEFSRGKKNLFPLAVVEWTDDLSVAAKMSRYWNAQCQADPSRLVELVISGTQP